MSWSSCSKEQFNLRFQKATGQLEKTARVRVVRRTIAKINTVLGEKATHEGEGLKAQREQQCRNEFCKASS